MFDTNKGIEALREGKLDIDCYHMILTQDKAEGERFEGAGYVRQTDDGYLIFKIYVTAHNSDPMEHFKAQLSPGAGKMLPSEAFYSLEAIGQDGTHWRAERIIPSIDWGETDAIVFINGRMQSMKARLDMPQRQHVLKLHFFEEFELPCTLMSKKEDHGYVNFNLDRMEFETGGAEFEIRKHAATDTTVEVASDEPLPPAFDLRVQEALQYLIARPAFWRARLQGHGAEFEIELASPWRRSVSTQFPTPISPNSHYFREDGSRLFSAFLTYVTQKTSGTHWNPVAYHLHGAYEATANSIDARAVGVCVAVEAIAGLIPLESDATKAQEIKDYQAAARAWLTTQSDFSDSIVKRAEGLIKAMGSRRPQDTLHSLALKGFVAPAYIRAWSYLRNRQVHPKLKDLRKPTAVDMQKLLDSVHKVEVLLRQLTFHLIGYQGHFTDYGITGFPSKAYPLTSESPELANPPANDAS